LNKNLLKPFTVRFITIGDSTVGKSALIVRYIQDEFSSYDMLTIGIDFRLKKCEYNGTQARSQWFDCAGQERFRSLTHTYYRAADGVVLVYDVSNIQSRRWDEISKRV